MAESPDWDILIRCKRHPNQVIEVNRCQVDVDGHIVVPVRGAKCDTCARDAAPGLMGAERLSRRAVRTWEKKLLRQIRDL